MTAVAWSRTTTESSTEAVANNAVQGIGILLSIIGLTTLVAFAAADGGVNRPGFPGGSNL